MPLFSKPTSREGKILAILGFVTLMGFAGYWIMKTFNLIPASAPLGTGYIDDFITLLVIVILSYRLWMSISGKFRASHQTLNKYFTKTPFINTLLSWRFVVAVGLLVLTVAYWFYVDDLIKDWTFGAGYIDDIAAVFVALAAAIRVYSRKPRG